MRQETQKEELSDNCLHYPTEMFPFPLKCRFCLKIEKEEKQHLMYLQVDLDLLKGADKLHWRGICASFSFVEAVSSYKKASLLSFSYSSSLRSVVARTGGYLVTS